MKVLKNNTSVLIETWDDPGDYPSDAGIGPLPSVDYLVGVEGELVVELTTNEQFEVILCSLVDLSLPPFDQVMKHVLGTTEKDSQVVTTRNKRFSKWLNKKVDPPSFDGILSCVWQGTLKGNILTLEVIEVEEDPNWCSESDNRITDEE